MTTRAGEVERAIKLGYIRIFTKISTLANDMWIKKYAQQTVHIATVTNIGGARAGEVERAIELGYIRIFAKISTLPNILGFQRWPHI